MGSIGSTLGGVDADGWKVAAALLAKNIGGGINFIAVSETLGVSPAVVAAGLTIDNIGALFYFPAVSYLANLKPSSSFSTSPSPPPSSSSSASTSPTPAPPLTGTTQSATTTLWVCIAYSPHAASRVAP